MSLDPSSTPPGTPSEPSLSSGSSSPTSVRSPQDLPTQPVDFRSVGEGSFTPGSVARPEIRRIIVERERLPTYLVRGTVKPEERIELFEDFIKYWNVSMSILDPKLYTAKSVLAGCPFLFTVVISIAARNYRKRELYPLLMQEAKNLCGLALVEGQKSVEIVQGFILLAVFPPPAQRRDEDKTWIYLGCATRLATDLKLNQPAEGPFQDEMAEREYLNRMRTWLIYYNIEVSAVAKLGKAMAIEEDQMITSSGMWWRTSQYCTQFDIYLCAFTQMLSVFQKYYRLLAAPDSPEDLKTASPGRALSKLAARFSEEIENFQTDFERSVQAALHNAYHTLTSLIEFLLRNLILKILHVGTERIFDNSNLMLLLCIDAASKSVKAFMDHHAHSVYFKYSAQGWFAFGAFAASFMIKLLGPTFAGAIDDDQRAHLRDLVTKFITTYASPIITIDENLSPSVYARLLWGLLDRADELNGGVPTGSRSHSEGEGGSDEGVGGRADEQAWESACLTNDLLEFPVSLPSSH